ncbi:MAG: hypothetical protein WC808_06955 [Patescibacteria group bacterium]
MSNTALKENVRKKWQKGVALLFALGILGLLLVMALGFATNSIFDQMIATNSSNNASARTIANSGLERVRLILQNYSEYLPLLTAGPPNYNFMDSGILGYSHFPPDPAFLTTTNNLYFTAQSDMLSDPKFFFNYVTAIPPVWTAAMTTNINWIYLKSDDRIIGRMAYIILNRADLDPGKLVNSSVDEAVSPAAEIRLGAEANEINLRSINNEVADAVKINAAVAKNFNYTTYATNPGKYANGWIDFNFLFSQFNLTNATDPVVPAPNLRTRFARWFICNSQNSKEAFWIDKNVDGKIKADEQFHRFNLNRGDLATAGDSVTTMNRMLMLYDPNIASANPYIPNIDITQNPAGNGSLWTDGSFDGRGIPWLATFGMKDSLVPHVEVPAGSGFFYPVWVDDDANPVMTGTFTNVRTRRAQIAANLIDYYRPATSAVTSDVAPANWGTTSPTFTGNKKTPYLNELGIQIGAVATRVDVPASVNSEVSVTVTVKAAPELIDIYGLATYYDSVVTIYYDLAYKFTGSSVGPPPDVALTNQVRTVNIASAAWPAVGAKYAISGGVDIYSSPSPIYTILKTDAVNIDINTLVLTINKVILTYNGQNVDCSNIVTSDPNTGRSTTWGATQQLTYLSNVKGSTACDSFMGFQTNDPRQNLNPGDWNKLEAAVTSAAAPGGGLRPFNDYNVTGTLGTMNNFNFVPVNPVAGPDPEDAAVTDPAYVSAALHLSTAFVREDTIVSPWELGFIHRGKAWETLNLHQYAVNPATLRPKSTLAIAVDKGGGTYNIFSAGGGAYADGDANILDQIKMNNSSRNYKIDINNEYKDMDLNRQIVLYSLFKNVTVGSKLTSVAPGITVSGLISDVNINSIIGGITSRVGSGVNAYWTRAQAVNDMVGVAPITGYTTKAGKEEIIGKTVNLFDLDSYFTVILVAQTIKDVGGPVGSPIVINKKLPGDVTPVPIDAELGKFDLKVDNGKNYYADEITSTLKVQALVHKKSDGTCEIISVKYIQ